MTSRESIELTHGHSEALMKDSVFMDVFDLEIKVTSRGEVTVFCRIICSLVWVHI